MDKFETILAITAVSSFGLGISISAMVIGNAKIHLKLSQAQMRISQQLNWRTKSALKSLKRLNGPRIQELLEWNAKSEARRREAEYELAERREEIDLLEQELASTKAALLQAQIDEQAAVNSPFKVSSTQWFY